MNTLRDNVTANYQLNSNQMVTKRDPKGEAAVTLRGGHKILIIIIAFVMITSGWWWLSFSPPPAHSTE